jgi:hypothetical protein
MVTESRNWVELISQCSASRNGMYSLGYLWGTYWGVFRIPIGWLCDTYGDTHRVPIWFPCCLFKDYLDSRFGNPLKGAKGTRDGTGTNIGHQKPGPIPSPKGTHRHTSVVLTKLLNVPHRYQIRTK